MKKTSVLLLFMFLGFAGVSLQMTSRSLSASLWKTKNKCLESDRLVDGKCDEEESDDEKVIGKT